MHAENRSSFPAGEAALARPDPPAGATVAVDLPDEPPQPASARPAAASTAASAPAVRIGRAQPRHSEAPTRRETAFMSFSIMSPNRISRMIRTLPSGRVIATQDLSASYLLVRARLLR